MRTYRALTVTKLFLVALVMTLLFVGRTQAQGAAYLGQFTLAQQTHWGKSVLRPGHYTMAIVSSSTPVIVKVTNEDTGGSFRVVTAVHEEKTAGSNGLLLQTKNGQPTVQSLALPQIGMILIYEPAPRRAPVVEAHASQVVPVLVAKK